MRGKKVDAQVSATKERTLKDDFESFRFTAEGSWLVIRMDMESPEEAQRIVADITSSLNQGHRVEFSIGGKQTTFN